MGAPPSAQSSAEGSTTELTEPQQWLSELSHLTSEETESQRWVVGSRPGLALGAQAPATLSSGTESSSRRVQVITKRQQRHQARKVGEVDTRQVMVTMTEPPPHAQCSAHVDLVLAGGTTGSIGRSQRGQWPRSV